MSNTTQTFRGSPGLENGDKVHKLGTAATIVSTSVDVSTYTVTAGTTLKLSRIDISSSTSGLAEVFEGATRIGVLRIGAGNKNATLEYVPSKDIAASTVVKVTFTAATSTGKDVEAMIQGSEL